jgi:hypothetical protein
MDEKTREKIREKNRQSKMAITSRDPEIRKKYNRVRNQVKSHVNKLKKKYEKDLVQRAKETPKVIWKYIKSKSKTRDGIRDLHMNPADTKSPKTAIDEEKANILAKYILSVFRERPFNLKGGGGLWFFSKKNILILVEEKKII